MAWPAWPNGIVTFRYHIAGELKLGNFSLTFTDLSIPLAGIPIVITREEPLASSKFQIDGNWLQEATIDALICPSMPGDHLAKGEYGPLTRPQISNYMATVASCVEPDNQRFADSDPATAGVIVASTVHSVGPYML